MKTSTKPKIYLHLGEPETTIIHRAGILGLWMTLKQLERRFPEVSKRPGRLSWILTSRSVSLNWKGRDKTVLDWLLKQAFQIDEKGLISLTGLNPDSIPLINKVHLHQVLTATLLQHNKFFKTVADEHKVSGIKLAKKTPRLLLCLLASTKIPYQSYLLIKGKPNPLAFETFTVDKVRFSLTYKKLAFYIHQSFAGQLCDESTHRWLEGHIPIVSWLYPGAVVRHNLIEKDNKYKEKIEYAFVLLFLPIACHYLILSQSVYEQKKEKTIKYLLVIPEPINLEEMAKTRLSLNRLSYRDLYISSLGEAGFSYYSQVFPDTFPQRCQVILYDKLMKDSWLRSPTDIQDIKITKRAFKSYQIAHKNFQVSRLILYQGRLLIRTNLIRGIIADNLAHQKPFWNKFALILTQHDTYGEIREQLDYNCQGLLKMIEEHEETIKAYHAFIDVIHETLRIIYAKIYADNPEGGSTKIQRENRRLKSDLFDCRDEKSFRHFMAKFLSKANNISRLSENRRLILPILTGKADWEESRDIAIIALSSYKSQFEINRETLNLFIFCLLFEEQLYHLALLLL